MRLFTSARALLLLLLVSTTAFGLSACGGSGGDDDNSVGLSLTLAPLSTSTVARTRLLGGAVEPGALVTVTVDTAAVIGPVTLTGGSWSCSVDLVPGINNLTVVASDSTGNSTTLYFPQTYQVFTLDLLLPTTALGTQTLSGTTQIANGALTATLVGQQLATQPQVTGQNWSLDLGPLPDGVYTLILEGTDAAGQNSTLTQTMTLDSTLPLLTVDPAGPVTTDSVTVSGTVVPGAVVSVTAPVGVTVGELFYLGLPFPGATVVNWSCTLTGLLTTRNPIDMTATAADGKQATAEVVVLYNPNPN